MKKLAGRTEWFRCAEVELKLGSHLQKQEIQTMVLNKPELQSKDFPSGVGGKKMGREIRIRGNKGSSLIPTDLSKIPLWNHFPCRNLQPAMAGSPSSTNTTAPSSQRILIPVSIWSGMLSLLGPLGLDFLAGRSWMGLEFLLWDFPAGRLLGRKWKRGGKKKKINEKTPTAENKNIEKKLKLSFKAAGLPRERFSQRTKPQRFPATEGLGAAGTGCDYPKNSRIPGNIGTSFRHLLLAPCLELQ